MIEMRWPEAQSDPQRLAQCLGSCQVTPWQALRDRSELCYFESPFKEHWQSIDLGCCDLLNHSHPVHNPFLGKAILPNKVPSCPSGLE